jgi:glycosyltransferase involved in cell wall biosynthesis
VAPPLLATCPVASPKPHVSVCVPTYNGARFLRQCLDSALSQSWRDLEILVVDDGSTDESLAIARDYARRDARVRVVANPTNLGLVENWNRCVALARGSWIKFLFQDDYLEPTCLSRMLEAAQGDTALVAVRRDIVFEPGVSAAVRQNYEPFTTRASLRGFFGAVPRIRAEAFAAHLVRRPCLNCIGEPTATMMHRSVFDRFGGFNRDFVVLADWEFAARVAIHRGLAYVDETLAVFRVHAWSASQTRGTDRRFRVWVLDGLIMEHDLANSPLYEPARQAAARLRPPVDLHFRLADAVREARGMARRYATDRQRPDPRAYAEWEDTIRRYPLLTAVPRGYRTARLTLAMRRAHWAVRGRLKRAALVLRGAAVARPS